jgi:metal-sulfur cluster biosynthetic enzyme
VVGVAGRLRRRIEEAVDSVVDPCSAAAGVPAGLAEMGLVEAVDVSGGDVSILLRVTHPSCFVAPLFLRWVEEAVAAVPGVVSVRVRLAEDTDWTSADMSADYRARLAEHRALRHSGAIR